MNFVPCVTWIKRGVAKAIPDKVQLSKEELQELIREAKEDLKASKAAETEDNDDATEIAELEDQDFEAKYNLENYDDDENEGNTINNLARLTEFASNEEDPSMIVKDEDDESEEEDDFQIRETDNLIAVGHVEEDCSSLEVHVYNEEEEHLYVHHDIVLPAFPLAMEWSDYDSTESTPGNYLAVSDMTPLIRIWDLDLVDTLEPVAVLGEKAKKKKNKKGVGHKDAVLSISWNKLFRHGLASGSADTDVILWDLSESKPVSVISHHTNRVQSVVFHPCEGQMLLTGSSDKTVNLYDCRSPEEKKIWNVDGEVENVIWNHFDPFYFLAGTDNGFVYCYDVRVEKPVYTLKAHNQSVTGIALSSSCPGCLVTISDDKTLKIWDIENNQPALVLERNPKLGSLYTLSACPDSPFVYAMGGDNRIDNFKVWDIRTSKAVRQRFQNRIKSKNPESQEDTIEEDEATGVESIIMDTESTTSGMERLSLGESSKEAPLKKLQKRKTFSKKKNRKTDN